MANRKPILFHVSSVPSYKLLRQFARHCVRAGRSVHLWYEGSDAAIVESLRGDAAEAGIHVDHLDPSAATAHPHERMRPLRRVRKKLAAAAFLADEERVAKAFGRIMPAARARRLAVRLAAKTALPGLTAHRRHFASSIALASAELARVDPAALVVSEDGISGSLAVLGAARKARIPVIDIPYGFGVRRDLEIDLGNKQARGDLVRLDAATPAGRLLSQVAPQWVKRGEFEGAVMFPAEYILAAESLGLTLRDAWIIHGGYSDILCAESDQMESVYVEEGVPPRKIRRTGSPYCDTIAGAAASDPAAARALRSGRRIAEGTTRVLVSWPPSYHDVRGAHSEFASYQEMTRTFFRWMRSLPGCDLTVSLHPAVSAEGRNLIEEAGIAPDERYVIELIPQHDVFVTYFSSTIRWAIACGKPVVNYDAYGLGLDIYRSAPGFVNASTFAQFQDALSRLVTAPGAFEDLAAKQSSVAQRWGTLDGRCNDRILAELEQLARHRGG